jgi:hypothetical protein
MPIASDEDDTVVSREQACAHRPSLDDPTKLASGHFHPRYADWLARPSVETNSWLHGTFEVLVDRLPHTTDDKLDSAAVRTALGARWNDLILGKHLGAKAATWKRFAALIDLPEAELMAHVDRARTAQHERDVMLRDCRHFPYRLQSWQQMQDQMPVLVVDQIKHSAIARDLEASMYVDREETVTVDRMTGEELGRSLAVQAGQFAWFLGAGSSAAANIPTGYDMIVDFKARLFCAAVGARRCVPCRARAGARGWR